MHGHFLVRALKCPVFSAVKSSFCLAYIEFIAIPTTRVCCVQLVDPQLCEKTPGGKKDTKTSVWGRGKERARSKVGGKKSFAT